MLLGKNFDEIDQTTIQSLVDAGATESVHLDFKRDTYGHSDNDKKELLKDITSFANCLGGHLIIGVDEDEGVATDLPALAGIDIDQELLRLENIFRTGIEPTIVGCRMKRVRVDAGDVIVIQIPRSFNPPHRVIFRNRNRYYTRNSAGVHELSIEELRLLFGRQRSIEERAKTFVNERFLLIQAGNGALPIPVELGAIVLHLVPLPDFGAGRRIDIAVLREQEMAFRPISSMGHSWRINLDGVNVYRGGPTCYGYTQMFRDGSIEATSASVFTDNEEGRFFGSTALPPKIIGSLSSYMGGLKALDASPPILMQISFLGMSGVRMGVDRRHLLDAPPPYEREELHLPPSVISEYRDDGNYESVVAEQMDFLWNVYNFERCFKFDDNRRWVG